MDFSGVQRRGSDRWPYEQIASVIGEAIRSGELRSGELIPSEQAIMDLTGAARGTVRHAIALLRERGLVYTKPRMGTFVSPDIP